MTGVVKIVVLIIILLSVKSESNSEITINSHVAIAEAFIKYNVELKKTNLRGFIVVKHLLIRYFYIELLNYNYTIDLRSYLQ